MQEKFSNQAASEKLKRYGIFVSAPTLGVYIKRKNKIQGRSYREWTNKDLIDFVSSTRSYKFKDKEAKDTALQHVDRHGFNLGPLPIRTPEKKTLVNSDTSDQIFNALGLIAGIAIIALVVAISTYIAVIGL